MKKLISNLINKNNNFSIISINIHLFGHKLLKLQLTLFFKGILKHQNFWVKEIRMESNLKFKILYSKLDSTRRKINII